MQRIDVSHTHPFKATQSPRLCRMHYALERVRQFPCVSAIAPRLMHALLTGKSSTECWGELAVYPRSRASSPILLCAIKDEDKCWKNKSGMPLLQGGGGGGWGLLLLRVEEGQWSQPAWRLSAPDVLWASACPGGWGLLQIQHHMTGEGSLGGSREFSPGVGEGSHQE